MRPRILLAFILVMSTPAYAAGGRLAVLAGGSGEDETENFLIQDLRDLAGRLVARGWEIRVAAGARDGLIPQALGGSKAGTGANVVKALTETAARARAGDELLVIVHSHGRARETEWGQRAHSIVSQDKDKSGAEPGFDLDAFAPPLEAAASHGARVALVDLSCYSGTTQALLRAPSSCTATLAAPDYVSFCSGRPEERHFAGHFLDLPKEGATISLEEQFLAARRADLDSVNLPELSSRTTPAAQGWNDLLTTVDPLDVYEDLKDFRAGPKPFHAETLINALLRTPRDAKITARVAELKRRLDALLATRASLEKQVGPLANALDDATLKLELPGRDPLAISPGNLADLLDRAENPGDLDGYSDAQRNLIAALRPELGRAGLAPLIKRVADFRTRRSHFDDDTDELAARAGKAMDVERELYDALAAPVADPARAAACKEFAL